MISYGRRIVDLGKRHSPYYNRKSYILSPTFEEEHQGEKVFFYKLDKGIYLDMTYYETETYIMKGEERIFLGKYDVEVNENLRKLNEPVE